MVENEPGSGDAVPSRGLGMSSGVTSGVTSDLPARARPHLAEHTAGEEEAPPPRVGPISGASLRLLWVLALLGCTGGLVAARVRDLPELAEQGLAAGVLVLLAIGLAIRAGRSVLVAVSVSGAVAGSALATQWQPLLAGAAAATAVLAACLAVLGSRPAATYPRVALEVLLVQSFAALGAFGVAGWSVPLVHDRFTYTVLGLALVAMVALVYRLAGGLHSLGRRGLLLSVGTLALLLVVVVYTAALTRYGSPDLVDQVSAREAWALDHLGGVPRPMAVLIGVPALAWGVSMRSRRRQGWWVCVFGTAATAAATTRLADDAQALSQAGLGVAYSVVLGLLLGLALIRLERLITGRGGTVGVVHRAEPGRLRPLH